MNAKVEEYRRMAEEAEKQAANTKDQRAKETYLDLAARWREMAEQAKRMRQ
jgi:hypothetical protein